MGWSLLLDLRFWIGLCFVLLAGYAAVQTGRLSACKSKVEAQAQEITALVDRIRLQNAAVEKLKADGDRRVTQAATAAQAARRAGSQASAESDRLKSLLDAHRESSGKCPAGEAVQQIRSGLR